MEIRKAHAGDSDVCAAIHRAARAAMTYLPDLHTAEEDRAWMAGTVFPDQSVWVAEEAGRIVGFAALQRGWLTQLYVRPEAQGRGVGAALLDRVEGEAGGDVALWVFEANEGARRLYERRGYRTLRRTAGENEEGLPDRLMVKGRMPADPPENGA